MCVCRVFMSVDRSTPVRKLLLSSTELGRRKDDVGRLFPSIHQRQLPSFSSRGGVRRFPMLANRDVEGFVYTQYVPLPIT